jgi:hypothetical protein
MREAVSQNSAGTGKVILARGSAVTRSGFLNDYRQVLKEDMRVDPRMAPWRDDPGINALLSAPSVADH